MKSLCDFFPAACRRLLGLAVPFLLSGTKLLAVAVVSSSTTTYNTTTPTVSKWSSGWGSSSVTGWDYVGQVKDASGIYLGNGWVLTAGHVGAGDFTLNGTTYTVVSGSAQSITLSGNTADLTLFQISTNPGLPSLTISSSTPSVGTSSVIIGYGGGQGESWASDTLSGAYPGTVTVGSFVSNDYYSAYNAINNQSEFVVGDSGGANFVYNSSSKSWELAGLNEAYSTFSNGSYAYSYFVDLSKYSSQINTLVTPVPEPTTLSLFGLGALLVFRRRRSGPLFPQSASRSPRS